MADAATVAEWRKAQGFELDSDFAFAFASYSEALQQAGPLVADAFAQLNKRHLQGIGAEAKRLVRSAAMASPPMMPTAKGMPRAQVKPMPRAKAGPAVFPRDRWAAEERPADVLEPLKATLLEAMVALSALNDGPSEPAELVESVLRRNLERVAAAAERQTLSRAAQTWRELASYMDAKAMPYAGISGILLQAFQDQSTAPARVHNSLRWMVRNLHLRLPAMHLLAPGAKQARLGHEAGQAAVIEPSMLWQVEAMMVGMLKAGHEAWLCVFALWAQAMGCLRFRHVQRSMLVKLTGSSMVFWCSRGKQQAVRTGFQWLIPRRTVVEQFDVGAAVLTTVMAARQAGLQPTGIVFDLRSGEGLSPLGALQHVRSRLQGEVDNVEDLTTYSFRRFGPSWALLVGLETEELVAMGDWQDKAPGSQMPLRYAATRAAVSRRVKHTLHYYFAALPPGIGSWTQLEMCHTTSLLEAARAAAEESCVAEGTVDWEDEQAGHPRKRSFQFCRERLAEMRQQPGLGPRTAAASGAATATGQPQQMAPGRRREEPTPKRRRQEPGPVVTPPSSSSSQQPDAAADRGFDEAFDVLAQERWRRPGSGRHPEPPTCVLSQDGSHIFLGGIDAAGDAEFLQKYNVRLLITCFHEQLEARGARPPGVVQRLKVVLSDPDQRDEQFKRALQAVRSHLQTQASVLVHCMAGVHRAPLVTAALLACVQGRSFWAAMNDLKRVRAIEPDRALDDRRSRKVRILTWLLKVTEKPAEEAATVPYEAVTSWRITQSARRVSKVHAMVGEVPLCNWRKGSGGKFFRLPFTEVSSPYEAVALGQAICLGCRRQLPAQEQATLDAIDPR
jgi:hypothetical protein